MNVDEVRRLADAAAVLHGQRPQTSALDLLDQVLASRQGQALVFSAELLSPPSPFGQLIAEAFDSQMTPAEWSDWAGDDADCALRAALLGAWSSEVLPRFTSRYRLPAI